MIDQANEALRAKGYSQAHLGVFDAPMRDRVLLKGSKIVSPFADSPATVLRAVQNCVPTADELGRRTLTPHELRACLSTGQ